MTKKVVIAVLVIIAIGAGGRKLYKISQDNSAFDEAVATNSPSSYAEYLANAGTGHREDARRLYSNALAVSRQRIREKPCHSRANGQEVLLQMVDFAEKSGKDDIAVVINRKLDLPEGASKAERKDETIPKVGGTAERLVSASEYFEYVPRQDQYAPDRLAARFDDGLKGAFDFELANADPQHMVLQNMVLQIDYRVVPTGEIYRMKRAKKNEEDSDVTLLYYGLKYEWTVQMLIPGHAPSRFELKTEPPADFNVSFRRPGFGADSPNDLEVYGAMENAALDDFYQGLVEQLCAGSSPARQNSESVSSSELYAVNAYRNTFLPGRKTAGVHAGAQ